MTKIISTLCGCLFGFALSISGMINPQKVIGFLDFSGGLGKWDYSLAFVMFGAVFFNFFVFRFILKGKPFLASKFYIPEAVKVDKNLILGSSLFGIGWGISGICPGPAMVNLSTLSPEILAFLFFVLIGMFLGHKLSK